jgi:cation diffusion facilitator family transporter
MTSSSDASREKNHAAGTSVLAAIGLTSFKIVVGIASGSLGILAEAAHSALDLAAAVITLFSVRFSSKPADEGHTYGHGKVESLSALVETVLLLVTCVWIIWGAGKRLTTGLVEIEVTFWAFLVIVTSIVVDYSRSRVLYRAAHKHGSEALEADALHFSTDIWSSAVVLVGLICVKVGDWKPEWSFLRYADAVAALFVAVIVIGVSFQLAWRSIHALLDAAPAGLAPKIKEAAEAVPGALDCHHVRLRKSGPQLFIDMHVYVDGNQTLFAVHELTDRIEAAVQLAIPGADVTVHPEPRENDPAIDPGKVSPVEYKGGRE